MKKSGLWILFISFIFAVSGIFLSCTLNLPNIPGSGPSSLASEDDNDDDDDDDDSKTRMCDDRDSCKDSCERMYVSSGARSDCYALDLEDVNVLEEVFDRLSSRSVEKSDLEKIDDDDLAEFLELSVEGWTDLIRGDNDIRKAYSDNEAELTLKWIAENDDIATVIQDYDDDSAEIMYQLMIALSYGANGSSKFSDTTNREVTFVIYDDSSDTLVLWDDNSNQKLYFGKGSVSSSSSKSIPIRHLNYFYEFLMGFMGMDTSGLAYFGGESFIRLADQEDNETAVEIAHRALERACENAVNKDESHEEVKQCLHSTYCSIRAVDLLGTAGYAFGGGDPSGTINNSSESIFKFLDGEVGRADVSGCKYEVLVDEDNNNRIEKYY